MNKPNVFSNRQAALSVAGITVWAKVKIVKRGIILLLREESQWETIFITVNNMDQLTNNARFAEINGRIAATERGRKERYA